MPGSGPSLGLYAQDTAVMSETSSLVREGQVPKIDNFCSMGHPEGTRTSVGGSNWGLRWQGAALVWRGKGESTAKRST